MEALFWAVLEFLAAFSSSATRRAGIRNRAKHGGNRTGEQSHAARQNKIPEFDTRRRR